MREDKSDVGLCSSAKTNSASTSSLCMSGHGFRNDSVCAPQSWGVPSVGHTIHDAGFVLRYRLAWCYSRLVAVCQWACPVLILHLHFLSASYRCEGLQ